jgi:cytoskeletal protein RodZ
MRGIGLEEIATATKISTRNLRALEEEKFDQLPGGIFNKGFVRAYAKFLGIDQDQIVAEYESASQDTESTREQKLKEDFAKAEFRKQRKDEDQEISLEPKSQWGTIAVIQLLPAPQTGPTAAGTDAARGECAISTSNTVITDIACCQRADPDRKQSGRIDIG